YYDALYVSHYSHWLKSGVVVSHREQVCKRLWDARKHRRHAAAYPLSTSHFFPPNLFALSNISRNPGPRRFSRRWANCCSKRSRASSMFWLLVSAISRHIEQGLLAIRVISRKARPPISLIASSSPSSSRSTEASAVAIICGRWVVHPHPRTWPSR